MLSTSRNENTETQRGFLVDFKILFIYLFIFGCAGSSGCVGFSLVAVSRGSSPVVLLGLLTAVASLVAEHRL